MNKSFIDYDFTKDPNYVPGYTGKQVDALKACMASYSDVAHVYSDAQLKEAAAKIQEDGGSCSRLVTRIFDQKQEGSCFPPGTLVTMATGEVRPIEQVHCLESVITAEGNFGEVRQTMVRPFVGQLIGVNLHGHNLLRCTPKHPILTTRGYVAAEELTADDFVAVTRTRPVETRLVQTAIHLPVQHRCSNELRIKRFNAPLGRTRTSITITPVPDFLELDVKLGRIIGLLLAEGNIDKHKIVWTFNVSERDTLVAELQQLLHERLGLESKLRIAGTRSTAKVEVYGTLWARLFESLCSTGSGRKRLHADLASGPVEFLRAVFEGWMAGDGYREQRVNTGVTISRFLAVQMLQIANRCGMYPALRRSEPKPNKHAASRQPRYDLTFSSLADPQACYRRKQDDTNCWRKVRLLTREDYKGPVFNLHVHGDESYVADGLGVHNCVGNGSCQAFEIIQAKQFGRHRVVPISAMSLYKRIGRSAQSGAIVSDAWEEMQARGVLPADITENKQRFKHTHPHTGFSTPLPDGWEETAAMFKGLEATICDSLAELLSALVDGFPVVVGREGHCICYCDPVFQDGKWRVLYANSWGSWGQGGGHFEKGFGIDTESQINKSSDWAFAIRSVTAPSFQMTDH